MATSTDAKERPIVFSAPMLGAILAGTKSQTRRVVRDVEGMVDPVRLASRSATWRFRWPSGSAVGPRDVACPFGTEGDLLWVRETLIERGGVATYAVDGKTVAPGSGGELDWRWKSSGLSCRFMPREASRLLLRVERVRVQRLTRISDADVEAEGLDSTRGRPLFKSLWEELHGVGSWDRDPWVWALTFDVLTRAEGV